MQQALDLAKKAAQKGEVPVGAVIVKDGKVIAAAHNLTETNNDPCAHAELLAIRAACDRLESTRLPDCDLYVTLEPCAMCAAAISFGRIRRLYFGAYDPKGGGVEHGGRFYQQSTCHHAPEVVGGMMESDCALALKEFFSDKR
ncbi:MAG: nucleoside deaminase [Rickettsiales bacterium]|nr:nucleoside deaminase [Rickettsiales bacterium]